MKNFKAILGILLNAVLLIGLTSSNVNAESNEATATALKKIIAGDHRSAANKARDQYRHPLETLTFFGIRSDMTVVEIFPGGGWYTEILAPLLREQGMYYAAGYDPDSKIAFYRDAVQQFKTKLAARPELYGKVKVTELAPPKKMDIAPRNSADMVLTFRNVHNWMNAGTAKEVFAAMYDALKPGGILGVVEHRGDSRVPQDPKANSGYVNEEFVIALAESAGFKFAAKSEINANPKDTKDYPKGVWTLPPTLVNKEVDKEKYLAIGESDRMTLKFLKPMQSQ